MFSSILALLTKTAEGIAAWLRMKQQAKDEDSGAAKQIVADQTGVLKDVQKAGAASSAVGAADDAAARDVLLKDARSGSDSK